ncbi:MAG: DUF4440 domain-containing protein [Pseudomonadota bacterium]
MLTALALALTQPAAGPAPEPPQPAPIPSLEDATKRIAKRDAAMFWYAFEGCDAGEVRKRITDDFRMVHDQAGIVADSGDAFAGMLSEQCVARAEGGSQAGYKNRRLLVPGSDSVTPLGEWGVLHRGWHTFHEWRGDPAEGGVGWVQTGGARFLNLWRWMPEEGTFRMQETISIDHGAAGEYPPKP